MLEDSSSSSAAAVAAIVTSAMGGEVAQERGETIFQQTQLLNREEEEEEEEERNRGQTGIEAAATVKKTRITKACDSCSRARRKCDGQEGKTCTMCLEKGRNCVFTRDTKKRGPKTGYVSKMKLELQELQRQARNAKQDKESSSSGSSVSRVVRTSSSSYVPPRQRIGDRDLVEGNSEGGTVQSWSRSGSISGPSSSNNYNYYHHNGHPSSYASTSVSMPPSLHSFPPPTTTSSPIRYPPPLISQYYRDALPQLPHPPLYQPHNLPLYPNYASYPPVHAIPPPFPTHDPLLPETWTHDYFQSIRFTESDGSSSSLVEWYFRYGNFKTAVFSMPWMVENLHHLPLGLLHAIYAACLLFPDEAPRHSEAVRHASYAETLVLGGGRKECNGWDVISLMFMSFVAKDISDRKKAGYTARTAMALTVNLKCNMDVPAPFPSAVDGRECFDEKTARNISRAFWFILYLWDFNSNIFVSDYAKIQETIPEVMIADFQSPNAGHSSNIQDNVLSYHQYIIPLVNSWKKFLDVSQELQDLPEDATLDSLTELEELFEILPPDFRFTVNTIHWLGRSLNWMNEMHQYLRLRLLQSRFLLALKSNPPPEINDTIIQLTLETARTITQMATVYLRYRNGCRDKNYVLESLLFKAGLVLCATSSITKRIPLEEVTIYLQAMALVTDQDCAVLESCLEDPNKAIEILSSQ